MDGTRPKGGIAGWLSGTGLGTALGLLLARLAENFAADPAALLAILTSLALVGTWVALVTLWVTGYVERTSVGQKFAEDCKADRDFWRRQALTAIGINEIAVPKALEQVDKPTGGPP